MRNNWIGIADDLTAYDVLGESYSSSPLQREAKGWTVTREVDASQFDHTPQWKIRGQRIFLGAVLLVFLGTYFSDYPADSRSPARPQDVMASPQSDVARSSPSPAPAVSTPLVGAGPSTAASVNAQKVQKVEPSKPAGRAAPSPQTSSQDRRPQKTEERAKSNASARQTAPKQAGTASTGSSSPPTTRESEIDLNKYRELTGRF